MRINSIIVLAIPLFFMLIGMVIRIVYVPYFFGIITWGLLAFVTIGWVQNKQRMLPLLMALGFLVIYGISLNQYYANLIYKYPGKELVLAYVHAHEQEIDTVFLDSWIPEIRGPLIFQHEFPPNITLLEIGAVAEIPFEEAATTRAIAFLAGTWESVQEQLAAVQAENPTFTWQLIQTWPSMEIAERSIHVVEIHYMAVDQ
ncbi:MAG: hypothetical protein OEZ02_03970 [Anaerolineae bacterium]|nr:hypothetical protein [Anaerolineae bacterium]